MKFFRLMSTMASIKEAKGALREATIKKLTNVSAEERKIQSEIVKEKLFELPVFKNSKNISVYLSLDTEINTEAIIAKIFEDGKKCFVPRYVDFGNLNI
ncbi:unnamed protein product [Psylliodes chrysocephalus]|uniref:5-formyltetrahydrofolate cyclo-ligase n=1 Tax=Psylliodes chrysocephalus TaxID=3402493 RepID=A0A9P0CXG4_9CUCU|nr:unnamed protein product [Psylliodes chrysocephala]